MTNAKRLGSTAFGENDPFDDLRPGRHKKVLPMSRSVTLPTEEIATHAIPEPQPSEPVTNPAESEVRASEPSTFVEHALPIAVQTPLEKPKAKSKAKGIQEPGVDSQNLIRRLRFSANVTTSTKEKVENASYWIPGLTISAITEMALEKEIRRLEKEFNGGKPFERAGKMKYGRPRVDD